jgi:hypothetical protein
MATRRNNKSAAPAATEQPAAVVSTPETVESLHEGYRVAQATSADKVTATAASLATAARGAFDATIDGLASQGNAITAYAPLVGMDRATCSGATLYTLIVKTPASLIYDGNETRRASKGSKAHFTRCVQVAQMDTAERREAYCLPGTMPLDKDRYILWLQVMVGDKVESDLSDGSNITRDEDGTVTAAYVKGSKGTGTRGGGKSKDKDKGSDVPATGTAPIPPVLASLIALSPEAVDEIVAAGAARLAAIAPDKWDGIAQLFLAAVMQRDRIEPVAVSDEDAETAALAAL